MENILIVIVLAVILIPAVRASIGHFRGEGGCCGKGSSYRAHPRKLDHVVARQTITIEGMSCQHCVNRAMEAINSIDGVSAVVHLKKGTAEISMDHPVEDSVITQAVERAGYTVSGIR